MIMDQWYMQARGGNGPTTKGKLFSILCWKKATNTQDRIFEIFATLQDQPERRGFNSLRLGNGKYSARSGVSDNHGELYRHLKACKQCLKTMEERTSQERETLPLPTCKVCLNWTLCVLRVPDKPHPCIATKRLSPPCNARRQWVLQDQRCLPDRCDKRWGENSAISIWPSQLCAMPLIWLMMHTAITAGMKEIAERIWGWNVFMTTSSTVCWIMLEIVWP